MNEKAQHEQLPGKIRSAFCRFIQMKIVFWLWLFVFPPSVLLAQPIRMESLRINGEIPVNCACEELRARFRIDSVLTREIYDNFQLSDSIIYIGESLFDYFGPENMNYAPGKSCRLSTIVFDDQIRSLSIGTFSINADTTVPQIRVLFPDFCDEPEDVRVFGDSRRYTFCRLPTDSLDYDLLIFFREDQAVMVHLLAANG